LVPTYYYSGSLAGRTVRLALSDREGQRLAVAATIATEVSGEVSRRVHGNLGCTGRRALRCGKRGLELSSTHNGGGQRRSIPYDDRGSVKVAASDGK